MASASSPVEVAFSTAINEFKNRLKDPSVYDQILQTTSIDEVYDATEKLQKEQARTGRMRHLSKIEPFLNRLREYNGAVSTFVQAKPEILALIWGPIVLVLQWADVLKQSFDAIVDTLENIGTLLPEFSRVSSIYKDNNRINHFMALFFENILDLYAIALNFFGLSRLKFVFEMLWPSRKEKISVVAANISKHAELMRGEVRLTEIQQASEARDRELKHHAKTEEDSIRQDFFNLQAQVSPKSYDADLYRFDALVCKGTGKWLLRDAGFKKWADASKPSSNIFWLKGIPGAGKTLLATTVIRHTQTPGPTIFAFLTYQDAAKTALSVLHSLIFQLASKSHDLMRASNEACRENMSNSLDVSSSLLRTLVDCAGTVYIVIDGLDEIDSVECMRLVKELLGLGKACTGCRILFSSRPETEIRSILKDNTTDIQVDQRNFESVRLFVEFRMNEWFAARNFVQDFRDEVRHFFASLAVRAKGMFLYVKVIFGIIEEIESIDDIREELERLPESLHDAYARVLQRINEAHPRLKNKARTILGFIGCTPSPFTRRELEQALLIDSNIDKIPRVVAQLDVVRDCGPIVEEVGGYVQFVHFTVKEYLFHTSILGSISLPETTLDLAICCVNYLCQKHHDVELSDHEMVTFLRSGAYRLHNFAVTFWMELVKQYMILSATGELPQHLVTRLKLLKDRRSAEDYKPVDEEALGKRKGALGRALEHLHKKDKELATFLQNVFYFQDVCFKSDYHIMKSERWIHLEPLTILSTSIKLREQFERSITQPVEYQEILKYHHGASVHACGFLNCKLSRLGFDTPSKRHFHERQHKKPWLCDVPGCEYETIGFASARMRDHHLQSNHQSPNAHETEIIHELSDKELGPLLLDLLRAGDIESAKLLFPYLEKLDQMRKNEITRLILSNGSAPVLRLLLSEILPELPKWTNLLPFIDISLKVVDTHDPDLSRSLMATKRSFILEWPDDLQPGDAVRMLAAIITAENMELYDVWKYILTGRYSSSETWTEILACSRTFRATDNTPSRERFLIQIWQAGGFFETNSGRENIRPNYPLISLARSTCSTTLGEYLIARGIPVDGRKSRKFPTALCHAASKTSKQAAEYMELLLLHGADPDPEIYVRKKLRKGQRIYIKDEPGPLGIHKWLGVTWDQLVQRCKDIRCTNGSEELPKGD